MDVELCSAKLWTQAWSNTRFIYLFHSLALNSSLEARDFAACCLKLEKINATINIENMLTLSSMIRIKFNNLIPNQWMDKFLGTWIE